MCTVKQKRLTRRNEKKKKQEKLLVHLNASSIRSATFQGGKALQDFYLLISVVQFCTLE